MIKYLSFICFYLCLFSTVFAQEQENKTLKELHSFIKNSEGDNLIQPFLKLSDYYGELRTENLDSMLYYASKALKLSEKANNREYQVDALNELSRANSYMEEYDTSIELSRKSLEIAQEINYARGLWKVHTRLGRVLFDSENYTEGLYHFSQAYETAKEKKLSVDKIFDTGVDLSTEYSILEYLDPASKVLEEITPYIKDPSISAESIGIFYTNLAYINTSNKNYEDAIRYYELAIKYYKEANNEAFLLAPLNNLADIYYTINQYDKSIETYKEAYKLVHLRDDAVGTISNGLAKNYVDIGEYKKAINEFQKSLEHHIEKGYIFREAGDLKGLGKANELLGNIKASNIYFNRAKKRYIESIEYNKKANIKKEEISLAYLSLSNISAGKKQYEKSLDFYRNYVIYKDSLNDEQNIKIAERYEFAKITAEKDVEITELETTNEIQKFKADRQRNLQISLFIVLSLLALLLGVMYNRFRLKQKAFATINEKNEENKLLMKEIHHRVKNNLQIILSLLGAQIDSHDGNSELVDVLAESQNKIKSMAIIHQHLYQGNQFTLVRVDSYTNELISNISKSFKKESNQITFETDIEPIQIPMGLAVPLGLILNELFTNCYKYAFEGQENDSHKVHISFKRVPNIAEYELIVEDNGKGIPEDINTENSNSFGMQLVQGLVTQLNGSIEIDREEGTRFIISLHDPVK